MTVRIKTEFKTCCDCHDSKPLNAFRTNNRKEDGYDRYCKQCRSERRAFYELPKGSLVFEVTA